MSGIPYQNIGGRDVLGWSVMACRDRLSHDPHTRDALYFVNGPYACPGVEEVPADVI